ARHVVPAAHVRPGRRPCHRRGISAARRGRRGRRAAVQRRGGRRRAIRDSAWPAPRRRAGAGAPAGDARGALLPPHRVRRRDHTGAGTQSGGGWLMPTFLTAYVWELRKLLSQKRTYLGLGATMAVPLIFVTALSLQSGSPNDVAFGKYVRESGLAIPLE